MGRHVYVVFFVAPLCIHSFAPISVAICQILGTTTWSTNVSSVCVYGVHCVGGVRNVCIDRKREKEREGSSPITSTYVNNHISITSQERYS